MFAAASMMWSFLIFVCLWPTQRSQHDDCGYAMIDGLPHVLNLCHGRKNADGSMSSDILSCNANGDGVELRFWRDAAECNSHTHSPETIHPASTEFYCSAATCASYVAIKSYTSNGCVAGTHIINNDAAAVSSNVGGGDNGNSQSNLPFEITTLRTDACFNSTSSTSSSSYSHSQMITCTDVAYTIHSYSDAFCSLLVSSDIIEENDCKEVWFCSNSDVAEPPSSSNHSNVNTTYSPATPGGLISSTQYFTTTTDAKCNFVNTIGIDMPTSKCMAITSTESQMYECTTDAFGASTIQWSYFDGSAECSTQATWTYQYPSYLLRDWRCGGDICSDDAYMELTTYKSADCQSDIDIDVNMNMIEFESDLYLVNRCMQTVDGQGVLYECVNNDENGDGGYSVTYFTDTQCQLPQNRSVDFHEKECISGEYQQHMTFCRGINNLTSSSSANSAGNNTSGTTTAPPLIDCNYFINDHVDPLGLIYEPLNECMTTQQGHALYSKLYRCRADFDGIEEVVFSGTECLSNNVTSIRPRPEITDFYCGSAFDCHAINVTRTSSMGSVETLLNYDAVMIGKQYLNDTCAQRHEDFWYLQPIIIDECWQMEQTGLYAKMSCDANGFVYHSLYSNAECSEDSLAFDQRFETYDCIFGKLFELVYCPRWNLTQSTPTTTTTTTTTTTATVTTTAGTATTDTATTDTATTTTSEASTSSTAIDTTDVTLSTTPQETDSNIPIIVSTTDTPPLTTIMNTNQPSDTIFDVFTSENEQEWNKGNDPECVNSFGGHDAGGIDCKVWEDIIWAMIVLLAGITACFCCWCWWSSDTQPLRKQVSLSLSRRRSSRLSVANGNDNADIQAILVEQLHKGQHINASKSSVSSKEEDDADDEKDEEEEHVDLAIQAVDDDADDEKLSEDDPLDI